MPPAPGGDVLRRGDLVIDITRGMQVSRSGAAIDLTPTEFQLVRRARAPAGAHLHARAAARRRPRRRRRRLRARHRHARQEHPPEDRAGSRAARATSSRSTAWATSSPNEESWRGWRMRTDGKPPRPPWWPMNEPWPPRGRSRRSWRYRRARFDATHRASCSALVLLWWSSARDYGRCRGCCPGATVVGPFAALAAHRCSRCCGSCIILGLFRRLRCGRFGFAAGRHRRSGGSRGGGRLLGSRRPSYGPRWMRTLARAFNSMTSKLAGAGSSSVVT